MKTIYTRLSLVATLLTLSTITVQARSWRIHHNSAQKPDFTDITSACASTEVQAGDTLYLDPGCSLTSDQTISKQVTVVGCGYFRADASYGEASILNPLNITASGVKLTSVILVGELKINADNVSIERCKTGIVSIARNGDARHTIIRQCYCTNIIQGNYRNTNDGYLPYENNADCHIENCIVRSANGSGAISGLHYPIIKNCYIYMSGKNSNGNAQEAFCYLNYAQIVNNVIINGVNKDLISRALYHTISDQNNLKSNNTEITVNESTVFALTGKNDARYQLKEDSPAKGYAADGGDIGPFGGDYPYVLSGLPFGHPYYTKAKISSRSENDKVKVSLQIKMQDE